MESDELIIVLNIEEVDSAILTENFQSIGIKEIHQSKKLSIDGDFSMAVLILVVARIMAPQIRDVLVEYLKNKKDHEKARKIAYFKSNDFEARNIDEQTIKAYFAKEFEKINTKELEKNDGNQ